METIRRSNRVVKKKKDFGGVSCVTEVTEKPIQGNVAAKTSHTATETSNQVNNS